MAVTPTSAQRPVRLSRLSSGKEEAPLRMPESTKAAAKAKARGGRGASANESLSKESNPPQSVGLPNDKGERSPPSSLVSPSSEPLGGQPRRSMTRARKPSSRLLPSPSPPPSRSSSHYHHYPSKANAAVGSATSTMSANAHNTTKTTQKKQQGANASEAPPVLTASTSTGSAATNALHPPGEDEEFGPGKRKRRPSTMSKPPSTITKQANQGGVAGGIVTSAASLKVRISSVSNKSQSPEAKGQGTQDKASKKAKAGEGQGQGQGGEIPASSTAAAIVVAGGYDSDGNVEAARLMALAEPDGEADNDNDSDAGLAQYKPVIRTAGPSRSKHHHHFLSSAREKYGSRRWPTSSGTSALEPPPLISRRGGLKAHQGLSHASQRPGKPGQSDGHHARSQSTSVLDGKWAWKSSAIAPTLRFRLAGEEESSEASDMDEEDDFHVAMLDGADFAEQQHNRKAASLSSKSDSHLGSKSDESEAEDTPATTPRSPQSTCDLPERRWSAGVDEEEKEVRKGSKDAVFAHALEPSSRRPHTHAGSLTLSLPFDEMGQGNEEEQSGKVRRGREERATALASSDPHIGGVTVKREDDEEEEKEGEEEGVPTGLLSPPVQQTILGLSSKQHAMMLSSPHPSSAFASPAFEAAGSAVKSEPLPLSLPPPVSLSEGQKVVKRRTRGVASRDTRPSSPSATHSSDAEEDNDEQAALVMEPPESMCLSELDRAWEQSEYLTLARRMVGPDGEKEGQGRPEDGKEMVVEAKGLGEEKGRTRGEKRLGVDAVKEEPMGKKVKGSPVSKSRRSTRQAGGAGSR